LSGKFVYFILLLNNDADDDSDYYCTIYTLFFLKWTLKTGWHSFIKIDPL